MNNPTKERKIIQIETIATITPIDNPSELDFIIKLIYELFSLKSKYIILSISVKFTVTKFKLPSKEISVYILKNKYHFLLHLFPLYKENPSHFLY